MCQFLIVQLQQFPQYVLGVLAHLGSGCQGNRLCAGDFYWNIGNSHSARFGLLIAGEHIPVIPDMGILHNLGNIQHGGTGNLRLLQKPANLCYRFIMRPRI